MVSPHNHSEQSVCTDCTLAVRWRTTAETEVLCDLVCLLQRVLINRSKDLAHSLLFLPLFHFDQFDLTFVEVHRVRRFRFTPRHCQSDSDLELDLRETGKRQIFSQICRDHPACGCAPAYSSWNCDGEILTHTAIDVRYSDLRKLPSFVF